MRGVRALRLKAMRDKEAELIREAVMLRPMSPAESLGLVSELTEFALTVNEAAEIHAEEKNG